LKFKLILNGDVEMEYSVRCNCAAGSFDRHMLYLSVCESFLTGKLHIADRLLTAQIASLMIHVEMAGGRRVTYQDWLPVDTQWIADSDMGSLINSELLKLTGMSTAAAEYQLIQTVDSLLMYGACYHSAKNSDGVSVNIAVTSTGVVFFSENWKQLDRYGNKLVSDVQ